MSTYATLSGYITFETKDAFTAALTRLLEGGWVKEQAKGEYAFVDECGDVQEKDVVQQETLTITIPYALHRNLIYLFPALLKGSEVHDVRFSCTDGCMEVGAWLHGKSYSYHTEEAILALFGKEDMNHHEIDAFLLDDDEYEARYDGESKFGVIEMLLDELAEALPIQVNAAA